MFYFFNHFDSNPSLNQHKKLVLRLNYFIQNVSFYERMEYFDILETYDFDFQNFSDFIFIFTNFVRKFGIWQTEKLFRTFVYFQKDFITNLINNKEIFVNFYLTNIDGYFDKEQKIINHLTIKNWRSMKMKCTCFLLKTYGKFYLEKRKKQIKLGNLSLFDFLSE